MKSRKSAVLLVALALLATGCRGGGEDDGGSSAVSAPGVTDEACPDAVNADNGCIYLGTISDLTQGPFAPLGVPITEAQAAFWNRVNEDGGIGGYDIDVTTYVKDNLYNPQTHQQVYGEIVRTSREEQERDEQDATPSFTEIVLDVKSGA